MSVSPTIRSETTAPHLRIRRSTAKFRRWRCLQRLVNSNQQFVTDATPKGFWAAAKLHPWYSARTAFTSMKKTAAATYGLPTAQCSSNSQSDRRRRSVFLPGTPVFRFPSNMKGGDVATLSFDLGDVAYKFGQLAQFIQARINSKERPAAKAGAHRPLQPCQSLIVVAQD